MTNSNNDKIVKRKPVEEIVIPPEKKRRNIKRIKIRLNDSTVSRFVTRKLTKLNDLSSAQYSANKNFKGLKLQC